MYKTILVPHGGTEAGDEALRHGIFQAKHSSSKIVILHVVQPWPDPTFGVLDDEYSSSHEKIKVIFSNLQNSIRKFLAERVIQCRKDGIECEGVFRVGKPSNEIIKYANEAKIDLIVMAKKKSTPNYKSFFKIGSVTKKVQEKVECPILLVEQDEN